MTRLDLNEARAHVERLAYVCQVERLLLAEVERLRTALLLIEEVTTDPNLDDKNARGSAWSFAAVALRDSGT